MPASSVSSVTWQSFTASPVAVSTQGPSTSWATWSATSWPTTSLGDDDDDDDNETTPLAESWDVPEEQDEELAEWLDLPDLRLAVDCGLIPWLALLGAAGNVLCVVVLLRQRYRSVAQPLLLGLWASDLLLLLAALATSLPCLARQAQGLERGTHLRALLTPQVAVLRDIMARMTVALTTALGVERCVAVTRPLKLRAVCTLPRTRTVVLLVYLVVFALQSPAFFRYDVSHDVTQTDNITEPSVHRTAFYNRNRRALDFYFDYFLLVMLRALPLVSMLVCFCIVLVCLKRRLQNACSVARKFAPVARAGRGHRGGEASEHGDLLLEERRLTRALLAVLLLCLLSELPAFVTEVWRVILSAPNPPSSFWVSRDVCRLLYTLNSTLHFPLFMIMYKNFSVTCRKMMRVCVRP